MPSCPACSRSVALARAQCLYCGATLTASVGDRAQPTAPAALPLAAPRALLLLDLAGSEPAPLAHIYRECAGATDLISEAVNKGEQYGMLLNWTEPDLGLIHEWIHWDDGMNSGNSIGTGAAAEFDVAHRWEPAQLVPYAGAAVSQVAFFPAEAQASYNVRVWIGAGAANMVVDQPVPSPIIGEWNTVTLGIPRYRSMLPRNCG